LEWDKDSKSGRCLVCQEVFNGALKKLLRHIRSKHLACKRVKKILVSPSLEFLSFMFELNEPDPKENTVFVQISFITVCKITCGIHSLSSKHHSEHTSQKYKEKKKYEYRINPQRNYCKDKNQACRENLRHNYFNLSQWHQKINLEMMLHKDFMII
jgi:hypothetical protein